MYEAHDIAKNVLYVDKNDRELQRYQLYVAIQTNSKRKFKPEEILSLPWDDRWLDDVEFEYNEEEKKETEEKAKSIADLLNGGNINFGNANLMNEEEQSKTKIDDNQLDGRSHN